MKRAMAETQFHNKIRRDKKMISADVILHKSFDYKVYKHNKLVESKSDFTAMEHRIIVIAISQITPKDEDFKMYKIKIQDVLGKKLNTSNYDIVRKAAKRLHKCSVDMEEGKQWASYPFITKAQGEIGNNFIEIQFHKDIQKFLLGLKSHYTCYTLDNVMNFRKNYSLRIYEFCKQYLTVRKRDMEMAYLRKLLSLEKKHLEFSNFKKNVLEPSLKEINEYSDIQVSFIENREGKSVNSIHFWIDRKKGITLQKSQTLTETLVFGENKKKLISLGFDYEEIDKMRQQYMEIKISAVLELFEKNIDEVKFPKPWIENALKENYVDNMAYKRQLKERDNRLELMAKKDRQIEKKNREIDAIKEAIALIEKDIAFYVENGKLRPGDIMRFPADYTVSQAIDDLNIRIKTGEFAIEKLEKEIEILDAEANGLS